MIALYQIEWNTVLGEKWLNKDNLQLVLDKHFGKDVCKVVNEVDYEIGQKILKVAQLIEELTND